MIIYRKSKLLLYTLHQTWTFLKQILPLVPVKMIYALRVGIRLDTNSISLDQNFNPGSPQYFLHGNLSGSKAYKLTLRQWCALFRSQSSMTSLRSERLRILRPLETVFQFRRYSPSHEFIEMHLGYIDLSSSVTS